MGILSPQEVSRKWLANYQAATSMIISAYGWGAPAGTKCKYCRKPWEQDTNGCRTCGAPIDRALVLPAAGPAEHPLPKPAAPARWRPLLRYRSRLTQKG